MKEEKRTPQENELSAEDLEVLSELLAAEGVELEPSQTIARRPAATQIPLSFAQQRLWFLHQLEPDSPAYHIPTAVRLSGHFDPLIFRRALQEVINRHEALRTTFSMSGAHPVQVISEAATAELDLRDCSEWKDEEREERIREVIREEMGRGFDLETGPLLRAQALRLSPHEHVVLLTMHHIISDGWSMNPLISELAHLYAAFSAGLPSPLPDLPVQYADYAIWQREYLQGEVLAEQLAYWREQLRDAPAVIDLPADHARGASQSQRGGSVGVRLGAELSEGLREMARREGVTLFMVLLAAFDALLYRYTRQESISVGTPIANRQRAELEGLIGFFVNTLVLRTRVGREMRFRELLGQVREVCLGAYGHQEVPFERLVEEMQPERDMSHTPLFQVMFVLHNTPPAELDLGEMQMSWVGVEMETTKFDLILGLQEEGGEINGLLSYNRELYEEETIERMVGHLEVLLEGIVKNPDQTIAQLPLLSSSERLSLLLKSNLHKSDFFIHSSLHELFEQQVSRAPDAVAVVYEDQQLSYQELNRRADHLAQHLRSLGVGAESLVAICMERSVEMVVSIIAILKAGGGYLPLDPQYPQARLQYMLADAGAAILLTQQQLLDALPQMPQQQTIVVNAQWRSIAEDVMLEKVADKEHVDAQDEQQQGRKQGEDSADNLAYVIYTSGSTGSPKGVQVTHRNVARLFAATQEFFDFDGSDVWTLFHSYAFDFSVWELWGALLYGGKLVVVPYWVSRSPEQFYELLKRERVTVLNQTPSAFHQLMRVDEAQRQTPQAAEELEAENEGLSLRYVIFGGEALEIQSLRGWFERHGDERPQMVNMYGITETTVHVTYRRLRAEDARGGGRGSVIGRPLSDLDVYVLDERMELMPVGVSGEIYVGGGGLARGYVRRGDTSGERYVPHVYSERGGERLYRTGDVGRYVRGGAEIEYVGRADEQVKVRGYRIELGEIEAALLEHHAVRGAVVLVREDAGDKRLAAYVVAAEESSLTSSELREFLGGKLPAYMIPATFIMLEAFPLTPQGKVDKRALPAPDDVRPELANAFVEPQTETERAISELWKELLSLKKVGVHDNFFDLGGHSMLLAEAHRRLREMFDVELALVELFRYPTISALANFLSAEKAVDGGQQVRSELLEGMEQGKSRMSRRLQQSRQSAKALEKLNE